MKRLAVLVLLCCSCVGVAVGPASAGPSARPAEAGPTTPPRAALKYRADLVKSARQAWGLDAPVAAFAAQVHAESAWNPLAVSRVGAKGMAQFMPGTATWWCQINKLSPEECQPENPAWALRALVGFDRWLYERVSGPSEYDRLWGALRAYNGGLGHWQKEAALAGAPPAKGRDSIDATCGRAKRAPVHCQENLGYPRRILITLQPLYRGWGREVNP